MYSPFEYLLALSQMKGVGIATSRKLISYCGSPEAVFKEKKIALSKIPGVGENIIRRIKLDNNLESLVSHELDFIKKNKLQPLAFYNKDYPSRLRHCNDAPLYLYVRGNSRFNYNKAIAIVGTRNATYEGKIFCNQLVTQIRKKWDDVFLISGLAYGVDIASQKAALKNKLPTVAVLAHALDKVYPSAHSSYASEMQAEGAIISEFSSFESFDRKNFVKRNRIIAGMCDALIVVESGIKGGAMVTAEIANSYNREVFAVPGNLKNEVVRGCHKLIKSHRANLLESVDDLAYIMNWETNTSNSQLKLDMFEPLAGQEEKIISYLKENGETDIDVLSIQLKIQHSELYSELLTLELKGCVKALPGKSYTLSFVKETSP